jgi:hypothetical protein
MPGDQPKTTNTVLVVGGFVVVVAMILVFLYITFGNQTAKDKIEVTLGSNKISIETERIKEDKEKSKDISQNDFFMAWDDKFYFKKPDNTFTLTKNNGVAHPPGMPQMMIESHPFYKMFEAARIYQFDQLANKVSIEITDRSTEPFVDMAVYMQRRQSEAQNQKFEESEFRRWMFLQAPEEIKKTTFNNAIRITVFDKSLGKEVPIPANKYTILNSVLAQAGPQIEVFSGNDKAIIIGVIYQKKNVLINGSVGDFSFNHYTMIVENQPHIYTVELLFSPLTQQSAETWKYLRDMMESFKISD